MCIQLHTVRISHVDPGTSDVNSRKDGHTSHARKLAVGMYLVSLEGMFVLPCVRIVVVY